MPRRLVALTAAFAVAWTALWPLVSSARVMAEGEAMPLCHQAGMMVDPSVSPQEQGQHPGETKQHCPLCIMAFYTGTSMPVLVPAPAEFAGIATVGPHCAPLPGGIETPFPPSRAPPAFS
jgi:hypothetical protein